MGGVDKGLLPWAGGTLVAHALARLAPQVGRCAVNADPSNAHYWRLGLPLWPDGAADHAGPLAGWRAALRHMDTDWLLSVPCDTPHFPADLGARLTAALQAPGPAPMAIATTADGPQPVFALLHRSLLPALDAALAAGARGAARFARAQGAAEVRFDDATAFADADTPADLARLLSRGG
jgi:molybdenum cofactor guanylyltransferase